MWRREEQARGRLLRAGQCARARERVAAGRAGTCPPASAAAPRPVVAAPPPAHLPQLLQHLVHALHRLVLPIVLRGSDGTAAARVLVAQAAGVEGGGNSAGGELRLRGGAAPQAAAPGPRQPALHCILTSPRAAPTVLPIIVTTPAGAGGGGRGGAALGKRAGTLPHSQGRVPAGVPAGLPTAQRRLVPQAAPDRRPPTNRVLVDLLPHALRVQHCGRSASRRRPVSTRLPTPGRYRSCCLPQAAGGQGARRRPRRSARLPIHATQPAHPGSRGRRPRSAAPRRSRSRTGAVGGVGGGWGGAAWLRGSAACCAAWRNASGRDSSASAPGVAARAVQRTSCGRTAPGPTTRQAHSLLGPPTPTFCQHTWATCETTRLGRSVGRPAARRASCHLQRMWARRGSALAPPRALTLGLWRLACGHARCRCRADGQPCRRPAAPRRLAASRALSSPHHRTGPSARPSHFFLSASPPR